MNLHHFLITCTWYALSVNANQTKVLWNSTKRCLNHVFLLEQPKNYQDRKNFTREQQHGPMTWRDTPKNEWRYFVNWQTKKRSNCTKFQVCAWMIITSRRMNLNQWENCRKCAHKLYKKSGSWHELVGQTFYGQ